jgi:hypothetical protein
MKNWGTYICPICKKEFQKNCGNHKYCSPRCTQDAINLQREEFMRKHGITNGDYCKDYYKRNKEERQQHSVNYRQNNLDSCRKRDVDRNKRERKELFQLIGDSCIVCNSKEDINFHEKHGKEHITHLDYYFEHYKDFVPMCRWCHLSAHVFVKMVTNNYNLEKFFEVVDELLEGKS